LSIQEETDIGRLLEHLGTHPDHGLSQVEAFSRLRRYGANELERPYMRFVALRSAALLCLAAGTVLAVDGLLAYAVGMAALSACLALATSAMRARCKRVACASGPPAACSVIRGGKLLQTPVYQLVPGDIVRIRAGETVPADGRLTEAVDLVVREESVSGSPEPVEKDALHPTNPPAPTGESKNSVFMDTAVVRGRGTFVVTQTGRNTRIGRIRTLAQGKHTRKV